MELVDWLVWADRAYFGLAIIAAVATGLTIAAGIWQNKLNARISENKDRAFKDFRVASEIRSRELEHETAEAKERTANLERALAWRRMTPEKMQAMAAILRGKIHQPVGVRYTPNDPESYVFAQDIIRILAAGEIVAGGFGPLTVNGQILFGVVVVGQPGDEAKTIMDAFAAAGFTAQFHQEGPPDLSRPPSRAAIRIMAGTKTPVN